MVTRGFFRLFVFSLFLGLTVTAGAQNQSVGILLFHGKGGYPQGYISKLVEALRAKGYLVAAPLMPWGRDQIYSASFDQCLKKIDAQVRMMKAKGCAQVFVGGHSLGAHMALVYAGGHPGVAGLILLAPGHYPEKMNEYSEVRESLEKARSMIAKGKGEELATFADVNQGNVIDVKAKPADYLSFCDPEGEGTMIQAVREFQNRLPVLCVSEADPKGDPKGFIYDRLPPDPKSLFVRLGADHLEVPNASINTVLDWLKKVDSQKSQEVAQ